MRVRLLLAVLGIVVSSFPGAVYGQSVYGYSTITVSNSVVSSYSYTELDYTSSYYYSARTDGFLQTGTSQSNTILASQSTTGGSTSSVSLSSGASAGKAYWVQTNHWVVASTSDPDGFSQIQPAYYAGSMTVSPPAGATAGGPGSFYVGTTWSNTDTYGNPPSIAATDDSTYGNGEVGTTGYFIIYGSDLTAVWAAPSIATQISINGVTSSVSYTSTNQVNVYYSIPSTASVGSHTLTLTTPYGSATTPFPVNAPPTGITGGIVPPPQSPPTPVLNLTPPSPVTGSAQNCNDVTGTWNETPAPNATITWSLTQTGSNITGSITENADDGDTVTWPNVTGQSANGVITLSATNPSQLYDPVDGPFLGYVWATSINLPLTLSGCFSGTGTQTNTYPPAPGGNTPHVSSFAATLTRTSTPPGLQITLDLYNNKVNAVVSGPSGQGTNPNLSVVLNGSGQSATTLVSANNVAPGSYSYSANLTSVSTGEWNQVNATWGNTQLSMAVGFNVLGTYRYSTYNVSSENACTGSPTPVFVFQNNNSCTYNDGVNFKSDFISFVNLNGTGTSAAFGLVKPYAITYLGRNWCELPPGATNATTFVQVNSVTGSCNQTLYSGQSSAAYPNPALATTTWNCNDQVLLFNSSGQANSIFAIQDYCPACSGQYSGTNGHIDTFNTTNQSCSPHSFSDYGNFFSIRLR